MRQLLVLSVLALCACGQGSSGTVEAPAPVVGPQGPAGSPGANGTNATDVTIVQFCPGTTSYPTSFAEVGEWINNTLYAVYWNGSAWLTEIPPGAYTSTSTSLPCNFTVQANCVITNN